MLFLSQKKIVLLFFTFTLLVILSLLASCSREDAITDFRGDKINVELIVSKLTFLRQTPTESTINEAQVLVFVDNGDGYKYTYSSSVFFKDKDTDEHQTSFEITLYTTGFPAKIYLIANASDAISANMPLVGEADAQVRRKVTEFFTVNAIVNGFSMWGEYTFPSGISSSLNNSFIRLNVVRDIARVDVLATAVENVFVMTDIRVFRANSRIQIAPDTYTGSLLVSQPSIPSNSTNTIVTMPVSTTGNVSRSQLYLPESAASSGGNETVEATCVIVGGRYDDSNEISYYRLDFDPGMPMYPLGQILRNHHYTFNITEVTSKGWPTPEEAANNASANISSHVVDWVDKTVNIGIYPDKQRYFILSATSVYIKTDYSLNALIEYDTDIPSFKFRWSNSRAEAVGEPGEALSNENFVVSKLQNGYHISVKAVRENLQQGEKIEEYFLIEADRLRILIKIVQE